MEFLKGTHVLEGNDFAARTNLKKNLTLKGDSKGLSRIQCEGQIGFTFSDITGLHILDLTFQGCGQVIPESGEKAALSFINIHGLLISRVIVQNSTGYELFASNIVGVSTITDSTFTYGKGNVFYFYPDHRSTGSQIYIRSSQFLHGYNTSPNSYATGIAFMIDCPNVAVNLDNVTLQQNVGYSGGNLAVVLQSSNLCTNSFVLNNSVIAGGIGHWGGGMIISILEVSTSDATPTCNSWELVHIINTTFNENQAAQTGEGLLALLALPSVALQFTIDGCTFYGNTISKFGVGGAAVAVLGSSYLPIHEEHGSAQFKMVYRNSNFSYNCLPMSLSTHSLRASTLFIVEQRNTHIVNCSFSDNKCSAILAFHSVLTFHSSTAIQNNTGMSGGAMALLDNSFMYLTRDTTLYIANNHAYHSGGGIYVEDPQSKALINSPCFFQPSTSVSQILRTTRIDLINNTANYAGSALYGGSIENCYFFPLFSFHNLFHIKTLPSDLSPISSDALGICFCDSQSNKLDCNVQTLKLTAFPGENVHVLLTAVGQRNGTVPGTVQSTLLEVVGGSPSLGRFQEEQTTKNMCTQLNYTVFSNHVSETLTVVTDASTSLGIPELHSLIEVELLPCPLAFPLTDKPPYHCNCMPLLVEHNVQCYISKTNYTIMRPASIWVGFYYSGGNNETVGGFIFHDHCPFDYCNPNDINITMVNLDEQCASNRSGILCGSCRNPLSLGLGTSQCIPCSNSHLCILIPILLAGVLLVFLLIACNLTVSEGTINGLVFYANIVQVNKTVLFPPKSAGIWTEVFAIFIAWLNLDLGIQTCFYDGMDAYAKAWLQFAFPIYIWLITGLIILLSRRSTTVAKLMGKNAVKVLATLLQLSFAKLLQTIIDSFSFTILTYPDGSTKSVWLYDGNLQYLKGRHIYLFMTSMFVLLCLSLPYTLILLSIQCLQRRSCVLIGKLKPFLDAYTGPYKDKYRFWTGHLLLVRIILFVTFAMNVFGDPNVNILISILACLYLLALNLWVFRGVYKKWSLDVLESSFIVNLGIMSVTTAYVLKSKGNQEAVTYTSIGICLLMFIGILIYHTYKQVVSSQKWRRFSSWLAEKTNPQRVLEPVGHDEERPSDTEEMQTMPPVVRYDEDREPLLAYTH